MGWLEGSLKWILSIIPVMPHLATLVISDVWVTCILATMGAAWGVLLAFGYFGSFVTAGYPNANSERHFALPFTSLICVLLTGWAFYVSMIIAFYTLILVYCCLEGRPLLKRFHAFLDTFSPYGGRNADKWFSFLASF